MTNAILTVVMVGAVVFALAVATDPKLGRWLAAVIYARALAVEASREMYEVARRSGIELQSTVRGEAVHIRIEDGGGRGTERGPRAVEWEPNAWGRGPEESPATPR